MATEEKIDFEQLLTSQEVADTLELEVRSVQSMISRGVLTPVETRLGRFVHRDTVTAYINERLGKVGRKRKVS